MSISPILTPASVTVTRNFGHGYVAANVVETPTLLTARPMSGKTWILTEALARGLGAEIPPPVQVWAWKPQLDEECGDVGSFIRVPFWRRIGPAKRGRGRRRG